MQKVSQIVGLLASIAIAGSLLGAAPASAATEMADGESAPDSSLVSRNDPRLDLIGQFLSIRDGLPTFDYRDAVSAGLDVEYADEFSRGYWLAGGAVEGGPDAYVKPRLVLSPRAACTGRNKAWADGWGMHIEMDTCKVSVVTNNAQGGAAGLGVIAVALQPIPGLGQAIGTALAAVASALGIGSYLLNGCAHPGGRAVGATAHFTPGFWCGSQS